MLPFPRIPDILEVTLRDGSYLVDFQFTADDTAMIASAPEPAGFRWIEVGHGVGLNPSNSGKGVAAASDEEPMQADLLLMDERRGREVARHLGIAVTGLIGLLVEANHKGLIEAIRPLLDALRDEAGFRISQVLYDQVLQDAGEP